MHGTICRDLSKYPIIYGVHTVLVNFTNNPSLSFAPPPATHLLFLPLVLCVFFCACCCCCCCCCCSSCCHCCCCRCSWLLGWGWKTASLVGVAVPGLQWRPLRLDPLLLDRSTLMFSCTHISVYVCVCMCACVCVRVYVCVCVHVYVHTVRTTCVCAKNVHCVESVLGAACACVG